MDVCRKCAHARDKGGGGCYCVLYGILIGYGKTDCRGFKDGQIPEPTDRD